MSQTIRHPQPEQESSHIRDFAAKTFSDMKQCSNMKEITVVVRAVHKIESKGYESVVLHKFKALFPMKREKPGQFQ